jgi:aryl carrier-like protein
VGYIVETASDKTDQATVAAHIAGQLPAYMVPTLWMTLDALPQTSNGKLDRKALPVPTADMVATPVRHPHAALKVVPPAPMPIEPAAAEAIAIEPVAAEPAAMTQTQSTIAAIWGDVLGLQHVGIDQQFFSLGADSLQLFRIVARMNERGLGVDARQLMKNLTIAELAASLDGPPADERTAAPAVARPSILNFKRRVAEGV